jgi:hypothetical protein
LNFDSADEKNIEVYMDSRDYPANAVNIMKKGALGAWNLRPNQRLHSSMGL